MFIYSLGYLEPTEKVVTNVYCGLVYGDGMRVAGCGAAPDSYQEFYYKTSGCISTVALCSYCANAARNTYIFNHRKVDYLVRITPDISVRGSRLGKGTVTYINPLTQDGILMADMGVYQGRHSKAANIKLINNRWGKI